MVTTGMDAWLKSFGTRIFLIALIAVLLVCDSSGVLSRRLQHRTSAASHFGLRPAGMPVG